VRAELLGAVEALVTRGRDAGAVRADVGAVEVVAVLVGASHAARWVPEASRGLTVGVVLDGLRAKR
jgi:hypothetical protein